MLTVKLKEKLNLCLILNLQRKTFKIGGFSKVEVEVVVEVLKLKIERDA